MKTKKLIIFTISTFIISISSFAQLNISSNDNLVTIGEHLYMKTSQIKLSKDNSTGSYIFLYKDGEYQTIQDWKTFTINNEKSINQLYDLCTKMITEKAKEPVIINLEENNKLVVSYTKSWKGITFTIYNSAGVKSSTAPPMKQKNLDSLFGKD